MPTTVSKPVLSWFAKEKLKKLTNESVLEIGIFAIDSINTNRQIVFEEEVSSTIIKSVGCSSQDGGI